MYHLQGNLSTRLNQLTNYLLICHLIGSLWGKSGNSLRSPWVNVSRMWRLVEHLALFRLSSGSDFWTDFWVGASTLKELFPSLFRIGLLPQGAVAGHWDHTTLSWSVSFRRSLKEEEIVVFSSLLALLAPKKMFDIDDSKSWSIGQQGRFSVKSLSAHLNFASG